MDINEEEVFLLSKIMKWYLDSHPRCPATKTELNRIKSIISKSENYFHCLKVKNILSKGGKNVVHC